MNEKEWGTTIVLAGILRRLLTNDPGNYINLDGSHLRIDGEVGLTDVEQYVVIEVLANAPQDGDLIMDSQETQ